MAIIKIGDKATAPSVRPSLLLDFANSKTLDPRFTFTRSTSGTYYDGKSKFKSGENLFSWSENGNSSAWDSLNTVETVNTTAVRAPDGTHTSSKYAEQSSNIYPAQGVRIPNLPVVNGRTYTFSVYVKGINRTIFSIDNTDFRQVWYNSSSLAIQNSTVDDASISEVGDGWYRLTYTSSTWVTTFMDVCVADALGTDGVTPRIDGNGIYVWGAQLEERSHATSYVKTAGNPYVKYEYALQTAPSNIPRIDHDPMTGESKGLFLETSARTNLFTYSEAMADSAWNRNNYGNWRYAKHNTNVDVAPDGTQTADTYESTQTIEILAQRVNCSPSTSYTVSTWIKATRLSTAHLYFITSHGDSNNTLIDYPTTQIGDRDDRLLDNHEWVRVSHTWTTPANATSFEVGFTSGYDIPQNRNAPRNIWLVWGLQLENGNYTSSYIKTEAATVTRSGESCSTAIDDTTDWYSKGEGTLYVEGAVNGFVTSQGLVGLRDISDTTAWNGVYVGSNGAVIASHYSAKYGGSQAGNISTSGSFIALGEFSRTAMSFSREYGAGAISKSNTVETSAERSDMNIPEHDILYIGRLGSGYSIQNGHVKKVAYYPEALDVDELVALVEE